MMLASCGQRSGVKSRGVYSLLAADPPCESVRSFGGLARASEQIPWLFGAEYDAVDGQRLNCARRERPGHSGVTVTIRCAGRGSSNGVQVPLRAARNRQMTSVLPGSATLRVGNEAQLRYQTLDGAPVCGTLSRTTQ